jgi:hypothetical protein
MLKQAPLSDMFSTAENAGPPEFGLKLAIPSAASITTTTETHSQTF